MFSAPQKRLNAKGRSSEMQSTVTPLSAASWLNLRTLVAHTGVSMLGKMLSTFLPGKSLRLTRDRSCLISVKSGAAVPGSGRLPAVSTGFPRNVMVAMGVLLGGRLQLDGGSGAQCTPNAG